MSRNCRLLSGGTILHISSNEILMSCPVVAFVAGVKMGSGSRSDSFNPAGNGIPQTLPLVLYSFHPDPDKYSPGKAQESYDKQYVRDYLEEIRWNKQPPAPALPVEVARRTSEKYLEAYRLLTGHELKV